MRTRPPPSVRAKWNADEASDGGHVTRREFHGRRCIARRLEVDGIRIPGRAERILGGREKKKKTFEETHTRARARAGRKGREDEPNLKRTSHGRGDCANTSVNAVNASVGSGRSDARARRAAAARYQRQCAPPVAARARVPRLCGCARAARRSVRVRVCLCVCVCTRGAILSSAARAVLACAASAVTGSTSSISMLAEYRRTQRLLARLID